MACAPSNSVHARVPTISTLPCDNLHRMRPPSPSAVPPANAGVLRLLVADDLTGAADACVKFVNQGYCGTVLLGLDTPVDDACREASHIVAINADTRRAGSEEAQARLRQAGHLASLSRDAVVFKKIDSSLRGHIGPEIVAALDAFACTHAIVAPSFPAMGRIVRDGWLHVDGPGAPVSRDVRALLADQGVVGCVSIGSSDAGPPNVKTTTAAIERARNAGARVLVFDAVSDDDLHAIVDASWQAGGRPLWVGSAGLAGALAARLAGVDRPARAALRHAPTNGRVLLCIGSTHPATRAQLAYLESGRYVAGVPGAASAHAFDASPAPHLLLRLDLESHATALVQTALDGLAGAKLAGLVLSGGDTAADVCAAIGAAAIRLGGEVSNGMPWGVLAGGRRDGLPLVLKSGAFGAPDALMLALEFLSSRRH
jgi:uncharacterized protein YgbK (DUF1537 family)